MAATASRRSRTRSVKSSRVSGSSLRCVCTRRRPVASRRLLWLAFTPAVFPKRSSFTGTSYVTRARLCYICSNEPDDQLSPLLVCALPTAGDQDRLGGARGGGEQSKPPLPWMGENSP